MPEGAVREPPLQGLFCCDGVVHLDAARFDYPGADAAPSPEGARHARFAQVLLPASSWAEADGQFMNVDGIVQESEQAIEPSGQSRPAWKLAAAIGVRLGAPIPWRTLEELRNALAGTPAVEPKPRRSVQPGVVS